MARSVGGPSAEWTTGEHLLATVVDQLNLVLWTKSKRGTSRPKPVGRPGTPRPGEERRGNRSMTPAQLGELLAAKRAALVARKAG